MALHFFQRNGAEWKIDPTQKHDLSPQSLVSAFCRSVIELMRTGLVDLQQPRDLNHEEQIITTVSDRVLSPLA